MLRVLLLSISFATIAQPVLSWGRDGHRMICLTAWAELSVRAQAEVSVLLKTSSPEQFAEACSWADDIRRDRPESVGWHFFDVTPDIRKLDLVRDCPQPGSCIVEQIEKNSAILRGSSGQGDRAEALKFLMHFVGDVHQPLHTALIGDRGGNEIRVTLLGREMTLHAVWDYGLLEVPPPQVDANYPHLKAALNALERSRWKSGVALDWAQETHWLMRTPATGYIGNRGGVELGEIYVKQNYPVVRQQVEKAGVRLAYLLNDVFK